MNTEQGTNEREKKSAFPRRVSLYETDEGIELLKDLARRRGVSSSDLLRMLIREEAERVGLEPSAPPRGKRRVPPAKEPPTVRPIWEEIEQIMRQVPEEARATLPEDLAAQHDHYLYGAPRR